MLKRIITLFCFTLIFIIFSECSDSLKDKNEMLKSEITLKNNKIAEMEKKITEVRREANLLKSELEEKEAQYVSLKDKLSKKDDNFYAVYTANTFTMDKEIYFWMYIPGSQSIKQRLDVLARALSQTNFNNLPIEVMKIEEVDGKRVAVINLKESKENQGFADYSLFKGYSWVQGYFQGSTGGSNTSTSLIETFLQRQYDGEWIDGVKFLYTNGSDWLEHVQELTVVSYRKEVE